MKKKFTLFFAMLLSLSFLEGSAQTQFWSDTFEDAGAPSSGSRTSSIAEFSCAGPPATAYFMRTAPSGIALQNGAYSGFQGAKVWAMEDIDKGPTCTNNSISANQQVTWTGINISGKSGLSFKGLFAADNIGGWQGLNFGAAQDFVAFEYSIDGGAWTKGIVFYSNVPAASPASSNTLDLDTNGDMIGDGASLNYTLTEYSANIIGTGTTLSIRMNCHANAGATQEIAIDNFRLFETPACVAPVVTANPPNRSICNGGNTTFPCTATGATGFQWQVDTGSGFTNLTNGAPYSNVTTNTLTITGATTGMNGYLYRCVTYNGIITCFTNSNSATLTISSINTSAGTQTNVSCNGGSNGTATIIPTGGIAPYTYSWSPSGGTAATASSLTANTYTVTVTDNIGCTATRNYTITQPATAVSGTTVVTNVACFGGNTGAINLTPTGGVGPYTFNWGGGVTSEDRTNLTAGTYSVTITDANGCSGTISGITITQPAAVSGTTVVTNVACFGGNTGAINLTPTGGVGPYTFNWGGGVTSEDRTTLAAGTYSVTITDANGCTGTVSGITITQPAAVVSGTTVVTNVACFGGNTGAINLTPTGGVGPYTFNWVGGATTEDRTNLTAGTYSVTITDANGCTGTISGITITQPAAAVSGTTVVTNVACFGGNTGAINLTPTGGVGPYTFNWVGGATTEDRTNLTAGTYSVTITDANGCTGTISGITITQPAAAVSGTTVVTNVACFGGNTGAINLTPTGGVGPYTFNWVGGATTEDRTNLTAGTYSVTITDANGCTGTVSGIAITQPAAAVSGTTVVTNVACFGGNTGAINLTPTGGVGPYTFNWVGGATTEDRTNLTAGTYSVTITDANGCTGTVSGITITEPTAALDASIGGAQTNVSCNGGANGSATVAVTGGTPGYTYSWSPSGGTGATASGLVAGTYTVTVTDANGCQTTKSFTITEPSALDASIGGVQTNVSCFGGANGSATVAATGGTPGYTYSWSPYGGTGATATGLIAGTYTVTVTDANGCQTTKSFTITEPAILSLSPASQTNIACNGGTTGALTVNSATGGTPGYTYDWTPGNPTGDGTTSVSGLSAGTWTCTVTDANSCSTSVNFIITEPSAALDASIGGTQTNVSCNGGANGSATVAATGGTPGYTYSWSPSGGTNATASGLVAGTYTVTVTDANGCQTTKSFTITEPTALDASIGGTQTNVSCNGGANGSATVAATGGTPGYTYSWSPSGGTNTTASGLTAGTYTVTVTDANGCQTTKSFTITEPTALDASIGGAQINVSCNGGANGSATVAVTGGTPGYTYSWSPSGGTGATASGLTAGTYTVTVTDANGCQTTKSFTITEPTALDASIGGAQTNVSCNGGANGSATVAVTGGTPGYTYSWSPSGGTNATASGLVAGTYTVTITDANGCQTTKSFTITEPTALDASIGGTQTNVSCNGGANGSATVAVTGGTPGYTYSWSPSGGTGATASGLVAGTYTVTVTDANSCQTTRTFTITEPSAIDNNVTLSAGILEATQTGATYQWYLCPNTILSGETNQTFTPSIVGDYKVEVTLGGCTSTSNCITVTTLSSTSFDNTNFTYYPNPTSDILNLSYNKAIQEVQVINLLGQPILTKNYNNNEIALDLSGLPAATYFIRISSEGKSKTIKILKQ